jgi:hypothetical protein
MAKKKPVKTEEAVHPVRTGKAVNVWIDAATHAALQAYIDAQRVPPTKTSVVETALQDFLKSEGFLKEEAGK